MDDYQGWPKLSSIKDNVKKENEGVKLQRVVMRYTHDCEDCVPLGQFQENDIYYCDQSGFDVPTVIARYGNDGSEYPCH